MCDAGDFLTAAPLPDINRGVDVSCGKVAPVGTKGDGVARTVVPQTSHLTHCGQIPNMCRMVVTGCQVVPVWTDAHTVGSIVLSYTNASEFFSGARVPYTHRALLTRGGKRPSVPA